MRNAFLLILLLIPLGVALEAAPGDVVIGAEFLEDVTYIQAQAELATLLHFQGTQSYESASNTILRELMAMPLGMHTYRLAARNAQGVSLYFVDLESTNPFETRIIEPSSTGFSENPTFGVAISTEVSAACEWDFYAPGYTPQYQEMTRTNNGRTHTIPNFAHRFNEGEAVPLIVRCTSQERENTFVFPVGWTTEEQDFTVAIRPAPMATIAPITITATSNLPARCYLTPGQSGPSHIPAYNHYFRDVNAGASGQVFRTYCIDALGRPLPPVETSSIQSRTTEDMQIVVTNPLKATRDQTVILSVETNLPARCQATFGSFEEDMGRNMASTTHQRELPLAQGTHQGTVSCTGLEAGQGSIDVTVTIDRQPPLGQISSAQMCGERLVVFAGSADDATNLIFRLGDRQIMRGMPDSDAVQHSFLFRGFGVEAGQTIGVRAIDEAGNIQSPEHTVTVTASTFSEAECAAQGIDPHIWLSSPTNGATDADTFDVVIRSEVPSTCQYAIQGDYTPITSTPATTHTIEDFHALTGVVRESITEFDVRCEDGLNRVVEERFEVHWDMPAPVISVSANPEMVNDFRNPYSVVSIEADQPVVCSYDEGPYTVTYAREAAFNLSIQDGIGERQVTVTCRNRGGREDSDTVTIRESYPSQMIIRIDAQEVYRTLSMPFPVTTSRPARCEVTVAGQTRELQSGTSQGLSHNSQLTFTQQGEFEAVVECQEHLRDSTATATHTMYVDNTPPVMDIQETPYTCGLNRLLIQGNVTDNVRLRHITVAFNDRTYTRTSMPISLTGLSLTVNQTYNYTISAVDMAGNEAEPETFNVIARGSDHLGCDTEAPRGRLQLDLTNTGTRYRLLCTDNNACENRYRIGTSAPDGQCTPTTQNQQYEGASSSLWSSRWYTATNTTRVCWIVYDLSGNEHRYQDTVIVIPRPNHCFNGVQDGDETGVDCGGSCAPCQTRPVCTADSDCDGGYCINGECRSVACRQNSDCPGGECVSGVCQSLECTVDGDCDGGDCVNGRCRAPTCTRDTDCESGNCVGGVCRPPACTIDDDCEDGECEENICLAPNECSLDRDCASGRCVDGVCEAPACRIDADCASGQCLDGRCQTLACEGIAQPDGTHCGGFNTCERCEVGQTCDSHLDCASNACFNGQCQAPTCSDGRQNQGETGVDCGGPNCPSCGDGAACQTNSDCETGICSGQTCITQEAQEQEPGRIDTGRPDRPTTTIDETPPSRSRNIFGLILIILGLMSVMGGSGYMYWEKSHGVPPTTGSSTPQQPMMGQRPQGPGATLGAAPQQQPTQPSYNFGESKLREKAREKKRAERNTGRKSLLKHFDGEKAAPKKSASTTLSKHNTPAEIANAAQDLMKQGTAQHEVSSALKDLESEGKLTKEESNQLRETLKLQ